MRVTDEFLNGVSYVAVNDGGVIRPKATAFFVRVTQDGWRFIYLVTARHVLDFARSDVYVVLNNVGGTVTHRRTSRDDWVLSETADVAVHLYVDPDPLDDEQPVIVARPRENFVDEARIYKPLDVPIQGPFTADVGNEVFITALFTPSAGTERNQPITRFGHIARRPAESQMIKVPSSPPEYFQGLAYLVDMHSMGGHSGAPCSVTFPYILEKQVLDKTGKEHRILVPSWAVGLLGLVSGHYEVDGPLRRRRPATDSPDPLDLLWDFQSQNNAGMAMVTPAYEIAALLDGPDLVADRAERLDEEKRRRIRQSLWLPKNLR